MYRFWGLSENLSWLAQFGGQGSTTAPQQGDLLVRIALPGEPRQHTGESRSVTMPVAA